MTDLAPSQREIEADLAVALETTPEVESVFAFDLSDAARTDPDALGFAVCLAPYSVTTLVKTHYDLLEATDGYAVTGRVMYVDARSGRPGLIERARRIQLSQPERDAARGRIKRRRAVAEHKRAHRNPEAVRDELRAAFEELAEIAERSRSRGALATPASVASPYREADPFAGTAVLASFDMAGVLEIVRDPFPSPPAVGDALPPVSQAPVTLSSPWSTKTVTFGDEPSKPRILVADDHPSTHDALSGLAGVDVVFVEDGWSAIDRLASEDFDLVLCAVVLGEFPGAKIHRVVAKNRPEMASRIHFVAAPSAIANAPPSSARARLLARPVDPAIVLALLRERSGPPSATPT